MSMAAQKDASGDDWAKPRGKRERFTPEELAFIRDGYVMRRSSRDVARDLAAASRTITSYYMLLNAEGVERIDRKKAPWATT